MINFEAHTKEERQKMLTSIGLNSVEELYKNLPSEIKVKGLNLPKSISEMELVQEIKKLAQNNKTQYTSFIGGGAQKHFVPAAVSEISSRFEFKTSYTPYQAEISQGTLQAIYEFQSMICSLTGMDVSNASMYDAGSACAEAILMAHRITRGKKNKAFVSNNINPEYKEVIKTYCWAQGIEIEWFYNMPENCDTACCVLVQNPDYYGEVKAITKPGNTILIVTTNPAALSILKPPVEADIITGDVQPLGLAMEFGGPHAGYLACKEAYMRQMPGRLVGKTVDTEGNTAYTLTIQTREQHIKREKATSNICSNQSLMALSATLYLSLLGEKGFLQTGILSANNAHKLSQKLADKGFTTINKNFFNEFVIKVNNSDEFLEKLKKNNILGGIKLDDNKILVCATEMNTDEEINAYVNTF